jgi:PIN domain nuclease of toxin-antitoxin system
VKLLLDTQALLWWVDGDRRLTKRARSAIGAARNSCFVSVASAWEMAIKVSIGKLRLRTPVVRYLQGQLASNGFELLPIALTHIHSVEMLPHHHGDPFDRLLVAQALEEGLALVSSDPVFDGYQLKVIW